jgi:hypothetical protein
MVYNGQCVGAVLGNNIMLAIPKALMNESQTATTYPSFCFTAKIRECAWTKSLPRSKDLKLEGKLLHMTISPIKFYLKTELDNLCRQQ